ncbi:DJ-1/PfpI family protein [Spongiimicrobium sp. 2-473A-2-J]|uniref:DJ-1/PfpI family protein n=1 Tax=Eudoraea algarum TaxID=3417568 RepID=UPI003D35D7D6
MKKAFLYYSFIPLIIGCSGQSKNKDMATAAPKEEASVHMKAKTINEDLPTIGVLIFEGVIMNEVIAPLDVFSNTDAKGKTRFNVITIATENKTYHSAHGLQITPDYTVDEVPELTVLVVPSSYNPADQTSDSKLVAFVREQNKTTDYVASHCAGAFIIGETGIADGREIVTYVTGGKALQADYPALKVADDSKVAVVQDGKFISSNGSLVSYIASFDLLEKLTDTNHRKFVESAILFDRLKM